jgi:hypothetical protein
MSDETLARFRALAEERFRFLESRGFRRSPEDEHGSPVGASLAWAGTHVGFLVSYDLRDDVVDVRVTRATDGRLHEAGAGGYSRHLLSHLVAHAGYRGTGVRDGSAGAIERRLEAWADFLRAEGGELLADSAEALP